MEIKAVGYVGVGAPDVEQWLKFGTEVLGMMPARAVPGEDWGLPTGPTVVAKGPASGGRGLAPDGSAYLKMDARQWRVGVHPSKENRGLLYLGLEVAGPDELAQAVKELRAHGVTVEEGSPEDAFARAVTGLARFKDPIGNNLELFYGQTQDYNFNSPLADVEFVAGHLGFGHIILFVPDMSVSAKFYTDVLGFKLTDYIRIGGPRSIQFLRCNERHHSIALADVGVPGGIHHMMFEVADIDSVGKAHDRAHKAGIPITASLGRHRNDQMYSFYMRSPFGFGVEIGCEGLLIDEDWRVNEFCEGDIWGHQGIFEDVQKKGA